MDRMRKRTLATEITETTERQVTPTGFRAEALGVDSCYKQATPYGVYAYDPQANLFSQANDKPATGALRAREWGETRMWASRTGVYKKRSRSEERLREFD